MTEYFASKTGNKNKEVMLIYNNFSKSYNHSFAIKKFFQRLLKKILIVSNYK